MACLDGAGTGMWRLAPDSFDDKGNPIFTKFTKMLNDPIFEKRIAGTADAIYGGNEMDKAFSSDWAAVDGSVDEGFFINARGGKSISANEGSQAKVSRYVPDGKGGYRIKWRVGRQAMQRTADPGEFYGAIHIRKPINGILSVIDQSRCGVLLFTEDGLYVDTIFPDSRVLSSKLTGIYSQGGEFFVGTVFGNPATHQIIFGMGKTTPLLFEAEGWSLTENPTRALTTVQPSVHITAAQIASPPEVALSVRGGSGAARIARFGPALGGVDMNSSLAGWELSEPIRMNGGPDQTVEVRCLYDPATLYLRWHVRKPTKIEPAALHPLDRIFTHDRLADTLSFYVQGDPDAPATRAAGGRPGDVRFVFGLFNDNGKTVPAALGMYPQWLGAAKASPITYATPVGKAEFAHVGPVEGAKLFGEIDADGKGFVFISAIPREAIPHQQPFAGGFRTLGNFSATLSGHNKFWWANSDGSASRETYDEPTEARLYPGAFAPIQFHGVDNGVLVRNWLVCGPFGGPGAEVFQFDEQHKKQQVIQFCENAIYPPDGNVDLSATYSGPMVQGYWKDPGQVKWKTDTVEELDTRVSFGGSAQTWFAAVWIHSPTASEVEFEFQGNPQAFLTYTLNGTIVREGDIKDRTERPKNLRLESKKLSLKAGWNQVMLKAFSTGYSPFRAGLVLKGTPETLWPLRLSTTPPAQ